jgi:hypothetical protein
MLKIQVLGKGLIPRGYGLAPRKEFFKADLSLIQIILTTPGLKVNMLSPVDGKIIPVTRENVKKLWDKYRSDRIQNVVVEKKDPKIPDVSIPAEVAKVNDIKLDATPTPIVTPLVNKIDTKPESAVLNATVDTTPIETVVKSEDLSKLEAVLADDTSKDAEKSESVKDESKDSNASTGIKPIMAPEEKKNNNQNNNHNNNNNHKR